MTAVEVFSPAKLNLFLAIAGRRADGFHELVSVVAPVEFGDTLVAEQRPETRGQKPENNFSLECDDPAVPLDGTNLVLRAAVAFAEATVWTERVHFRLTKRIPIGAGLGGGSSNAVAALRVLNRIAGGLLDTARLADLAAELGSDCPLFLQDGPVRMSGRGERVEALPARALARLRGRRVLMFKPSFGISTAWAYARMAAEAPRHYLPAAEAEARVAGWIGDDELPGQSLAEELLFNGMEGVAFAKFLALPVLLDVLYEEFGLTARMSGSGSACFALLPDGVRDAQVAAITARIRGLWGEGAFVTETKIF
ncbi:MAG: 4-(cytidine 5'-diphospho)-2-C-methyl-D-erythritol kinase [Verrucomicrobiota bacterium]